MAVDERLRRLAPIATGAAGFGLAALRTRAGGVSEREMVACAAIAVAAALVAYAIVAVRGSVGIVAGVVAGLWLAVTAAGVTATATATAAAAVCLILARADKRESAPPMIAAPVAVAVVVLDPRAWALAAVVAALVAWREQGRRRWLAAAPAIAAIAGGVLTLMATFGRAPTWAPHASHVGPSIWLDGAVDSLGPVAIVVGAIGVVIAIEDRRARWSAAAIVGALLSALPLSTSAPSAFLVSFAMSLGMSASAISARIGRTRHQAIIGLALATVLIAQLII